MTDIDIGVRIRGAAASIRDGDAVKHTIEGISSASRSAARSAVDMSSAVTGALSHARREAQKVASVSRYGSAGLLGGALFGVGGAIKQGLEFNAQVEDAQQRFRIFTDDVNGLLRAVQGIDRSSAFNFGDLADAAANLGNANIRDIPKVLQGAANAAAASGKGTPALQSIVIALGQIQNKGRLSQEELNQLAEAGAPQVMNTIAKGFGLTAKELGNIGGQGLDATKAIQLLTDEWTSGKMAEAAKRQLRTLGGQWQLVTGDFSKLAGKATEPLARSLEKDVLPAADRAAAAIQKILGTEGLSDAQKYAQIRAAIKTNLGPVWDDFTHTLDQADIPDRLDDAFEAAAPKILASLGEIGKDGAEAFGKAWLHAGIWGKFAGGALLLHILGLDTAILTGLGKKLGGLGRSPAGSIATKAAPIPVFVTNQGWGVPGGGGTGPVLVGHDGTPKEPPLSRGERIRRTLGTGVRRAGEAAVVGTAYETYLQLGKQLGIGQAGFGGAPVPKNIPGARQSMQDLIGEGVFPPGTQRVTNVTQVNLDGKTVARVTSPYDAVELGRLDASQAARR